MPAPAERENADRAAGTLVYGLYLAAPVTFGLTGLAGAVMAARRRDRAGPVAATHFRFQLWTFWGAVLAVAAGALWALLGGAQTTGTGDGDGAWLALAGLALCAGAGVGYLAATVYGLSRLLSRSPVGRFLSR
ncbi:MAG TPA: hypothetical protein VF699_03645 [Caulobacteraceae bacterium]